MTPACSHAGFSLITCELTSGHTMIYKTCHRCRAWLSLGPSNDKPPEVKIEIRAAEIYVGAPSFLGVYISRAEVYGWFAGMEERDLQPDEAVSGWLAAVIWQHGRERAPDGSWWPKTDATTEVA